MVGIAIGVIFLGKQNPACKDFGKVRLFTAVARFVISIFIAVVILVYVLVSLVLYMTPIPTCY